MSSMRFTALDVISLDNALFRTFLFYTAVLMLKMLFMSILTAVQRFRSKAFANPEDADANNCKVKTDERVERVRRAHLNDIENIPVFVCISFGYVMTNPNMVIASLLFKIFTVARFIHTIVYAIYVVPQPGRGLAFGVGFFISVYMAVSTVLHFAH